jgi:tetratricopeptide (TPR) repeat protein
VEVIDPESTLPESKKSLSSINNFKGFCYLALNKVEDAKECFEKSLQANPKSSQACAGLGEVFFLMHDEKKAKQMYEWAVKNEPENKFAVAGLGKVNKILGLDITDTDMDSEKMQEVAEDISKLINDGYELFTKKEFEKSIELLLKGEKLVEKNFKSEQSKETLSSLNNFLGFNYLSLKDNDKAKKCFEKSLESNPKSSQSCAGLGEIYFLEGDDEKSKTMFEWALENNPENQFAIAGLSKVNDALGYPKDHNSKLEK